MKCRDSRFCSSLEQSLNWSGPTSQKHLLRVPPALSVKSRPVTMAFTSSPDAGPAQRSVPRAPCQFYRKGSKRVAWPQVWWVVSERPVCLGDSASSSLPPGSGGAGLGFSQTSLLPRHASSAAAPAACPQWAPPTPTCSAPISPPSSDFSPDNRHC